MAYWVVPPEWVGETCVILAGGPSLEGFDAHCLASLRVIAINESYRLWPSSDVLYWADIKWWNRRCQDVAYTFSGRYIVTVAEKVNGPVKQLRNTGVEGFDPDPGALRTGANSGYQAIHLAVHFGAKRIILLGYDMQVDRARTHWHEGHPGQQPSSLQATLTQTFLPKFQGLVEPLRERGIEVIISDYRRVPDTPLTWAMQDWPARTLDSVLAEERELVA